MANRLSRDSHPCAIFAVQLQVDFMSVFDPQNPFGRGLAASILSGAQPATKRKVYFAFHYDDIMRVNNVRNAWKIDHPDSLLNRSFSDSSLWESRKAEGDESVKRLIREGVAYTSVVCVLVGTQTWSRRWVKYEIARSLIDSRGLLAVHINGINHHVRRGPDSLGANPIGRLGIYKGQDGQFKLYEWREIITNFLTGQRNSGWYPYEDYTQSVPLPRYLREPDVGYVMPLSSGTVEHNFAVDNGDKNLGDWVDQAAQAVGR